MFFRAVACDALVVGLRADNVEFGTDLTNELDRRRVVHPNIP